MSIPVKSTPSKSLMAFRPVKVPPDKLDFEYPLSSWNDLEFDDLNIDYKNYDNCETPSEEGVRQMLSDFKFDEVFYFQEGECDEEAWILFVRIGDLYIYYEGSYCYTGFGASGYHQIEYSKNIDNIWNNSLSSEIVRDEILRN